MKINTTLFNCDKDKNNSSCVFNNFKANLLPNLEAMDITDEKILIGPHLYFKKYVLEEIEELSKRIRAQWFTVQDVVINNSNIPHSELIVAREYINAGFYAISEALKNSHPTAKENFKTKGKINLKKFATCVVPFAKLENNMVIKISVSLADNKSCPLYQYFHTYLDLQYYLLMIAYFCDKTENQLEDKLTRLLEDFMVLSRKSFERHSGNPNSNVFICDCMKQFWILTQILIEKLSNGRTRSFWERFNKVFEQEEAFFVLWVLRGISNLHMYNSSLEYEENHSDRITPNYALLELKLKEILTLADSEVLVRTYKVIEPLVTDLWLNHAKIEIYQTLWDFYSKRLNVSTRKAHVNKITAIEICETIDKILWSSENCTEDFEIFVSMLVRHLRKYPSHWAKMKGRICSQLGPNKVKDLSEIGVLHVALLFISLASTINFDELSKKIISFLASLPQEKKNTLLVWNIYGAFILRHIQEGHSIENIATLFSQKLQDASNNASFFHLIKEFIITYEIIIQTSPNMQLHQWILLDSCLGKYFSKCYAPDLVKVLDVVKLTLEKCSNADSWALWEGTFKENIYPILKQLALTAHSLGVIGTIVGKLSLLIPSLIAEAFSYFNSDTISPQISAHFIQVILENYPNSFMILPHQEHIIIQSWSKVCFLAKDLSVELTDLVTKLDIFPNALKLHLKNSTEPLCSLIEYLGTDIKNHMLSPNINKLCELVFEHASKFLAPFLTNSDNEIVVYRVYKLVSVTFLNCGNLLYNRNKSSCAVTSLTQCLLFPIEFLTGKRPLTDCTLNAVNKTWHTFFEAFVKLNSNCDTFLERTLKSMVTKYLPYFSVTDSPIIKCLENENTTGVILEKFATAYFKHPVRETEANVHKALNILKDFVQSTTSTLFFKLIIKHVLLGLFEIVIFHAQRNTAVSVLQVITCNPLYPSIRSDFKATVVALTNKYLQFYSETYFQLISVLSKFIPGDIKSLLPNIKQQVASAERLRGVGYDKNLRMQLEKLENALEP